MDIIVSPLAQRMASRDVRDQVLPALTIVCHITGRQTWKNAAKKKVPVLAHAADYFGKNGKPFAHYTVDPWGRIGSYASEIETPWAQGWAEYGGLGGLRKLLSTGKLVVPKWWLDAWAAPGMGHSWPRAILSPADLVLPGLDSPNERSIAIEFVQWGNQLRLTQAQVLSGNMLVLDIATRHGIPVELPYIRGHEDVDPWGRGTKTGGWDPGAHRPNPDFSWSALLDLELTDAPIIPTPPMPDWECRL